MTDEHSPLLDALRAAKADVTGVDARNRLATMLLTAGILAFGVMLGAHLMAADLLFGVPLPPPEQRYRDIMRLGMFGAGGCLVVGVFLATEEADTDG